MSLSTDLQIEINDRVTPRPIIAQRSSGADSEGDICVCSVTVFQAVRTQKATYAYAALQNFFYVHMTVIKLR